MPGQVSQAHPRRGRRYREKRLNSEIRGSPSRRTLVHGGTILPCDGTTAPQEALVIENGRIVALGARGDMETIAGGDARRLDAEGAIVLPGLVDTHPHAMHFSALALPLVDLSDARNHDDIVARIAARARSTPKGEWIVCTPVGEAHYYIRRSYRDLEESRLPDRRVLDRATSDHPVFIQAWAPRIPNAVAFNSLGLRRAGLSHFTPARVCNVWIEKDAHGTPTGIVNGSVTNYYTDDPFWIQIRERISGPPPDSIWEAAGRAGMASMNALGATTIYESHIMEPAHVEGYRQLRRSGAMTCRVKTTLEVAGQAFDPHLMPTDDDLRDRLRLALASTDRHDPLLRHDGVTIARTGPCFPGFLTWHEPFKSPYGELINGYEFLPARADDIIVDFCIEHGLRLNSVVGSYKDHDDLLRSIDRYPTAAVRDRGWIAQHAIFTAESHARRYAELGMKITTSKGFHWGKGDMYGERLGRHVWKDLVPLRRLLDHNLPVGCGTDWGPRNIFEQMQLAVTCEFAGSRHRNLDAGQAVTREEALLLWTRDAARVLEWQGVGTLAAGGCADLVFVDRNPVTCPIEDLPDTRVLRTVFDGRTVYEA
jgi:hypothetical protein